MLGSSTSRAVEVLLSICRDPFDWDISERDLIVVHRLNSRRVGVLIRLSSLDLKRRFLLKSGELKTYGIIVSLS